MDAEAVGTLQHLAWQTAYRGVLPDTLLDGLDLEARIARRREHFTTPTPGIDNWVAEVDGRVVGWGAVGPTRDEGVVEGTFELYALYVHPSEVGRGYGKALMRHALREAAGAPAMVLWVLVGNQRARRFYEGAGFEVDPTVEPVEFNDTGALKLRMRLAT